ncbi:ATP synthase epsilon chain [Candidatus Desulfarcum epimagneticum]|uniref:ATP synthase epsilon chain n=1 Tax=uncultured Desulfobacteraceae bacterium TaxID=218296 RepID=A0A484HFW1_9BACT|nr:ATP synthase epsilon chain [uncultured Desulfobacteraceae bacterium]
MDGHIRLEVVTPDKAVVDEDAKIAMAPGELGEFGVLIGHTPFLTALKVGAIRYVDSSGAEKQVFVNGGFAEALPKKLTVLAESAERRSDIDPDRARASMERAQNRLADKSRADEIDYIRAKAALDRAVQRIRMLDVA